MTKQVLDANGRAIKVGDRVRITYPRYTVTSINYELKQVVVLSDSGNTTVFHGTSVQVVDEAKTIKQTECVLDCFANVLQVGDVVTYDDVDYFVSKLNIDSSEVTITSQGIVTRTLDGGEVRKVEDYDS